MLGGPVTQDLVSLFPLLTPRLIVSMLTGMIPPDDRRIAGWSEKAVELSVSVTMTGVQPAICVERA